MPSSTSPPQWPLRLLSVLIAERFQDELLGDLHEWYHFMATRYSPRALRRRFVWEVFRSLRWFRLKKVTDLLITLIDHPMFRNDIKMAVRSTLKRRFYTSMNLLGLTTGLTVCLFIYTFMQHERSFDRFHTKADEIYRVLRQDPNSKARGVGLSSQSEKALNASFPNSLTTVSLGQDPVVSYSNGAEYYEESFYWTGENFFNIFDFELLDGDPATALSQPNQVVLTESVAKKLFPDGNAYGQPLDVKVYDSDTLLVMQVSGVVADPPLNSHIQFAMLGSMVTGEHLYGNLVPLWGFSWVRTYMHLSPTLDLSTVRTGVSDYLDEHVSERHRNMAYMDFQPLSEVYLHSTDIGKAPHDLAGDARTLSIFLLVGILVLAVAILNFVNLSTAQLTNRAREVGVRKTLGAFKQRLVQQFLTETYLITTISLLLAGIAVHLLWPFFQQVSGLAIPLSFLYQPTTLWGIGIIWLLTGLLAGSYPALTMAGFSPLRALRGEVKQTRVRLRQGFVTTQFILSIFLLMSTVMVFAQFRHLMDGDLGYDEEHLLLVPVEDRTMQQTLSTLRNQVAELPGVVSVATSGEQLPSQFNNTWGLRWNGQQEDQIHGIDVVAIDEHFFSTLGVELVAGRDITPGQEAGEGRAEVILNQAALQAMGWEETVGGTIELDGNAAEVVGIAPDIRHQSMKNTVHPLVYLKTHAGHRASPDNLIMRLDPSQTSATITALDRLWKSQTEGIPLSFSFIEEEYASYYQAEQQFFTLFAIFSVLGIIIACLGLLAMVIYVVNQRKKELSIRKVLGATVNHVVFRIGREFTLIVLLAFVLAAPLAYYFGTQWLAQYPNRIQLGAGLFVLAAVISLGLCWGTIGYHTLRAAYANPATHLKDD
ncbi:MAG: ABC transporter permease [Bacteroidota bacterium]